MNHLIAKVSKRSKPKFYRLLSNRSVYEFSPNNVSYINYDPDHNLDEDSWFKIEGFSKKDYFIDILEGDFVSSEYNDIPKEFFSKISYICSIQDGVYFFQKITPSLIATRKTISFGDKVDLDEDTTRLFINSYPDAVYIKEEDVLIFRNLATISSIFKGIDELFKEATEEEVREFLDESFVSLKGDYDIEDVSKPNRKRIALARKTLTDMSAEERGSMFRYIKEYCSDYLDFDEYSNKINIKSNEELKIFVYGIEQRFYTAPISQERRLANSVVPIG